MDSAVQKEVPLAEQASKYVEWLAKFFVIVTPLAYLGGRYFTEGYLNAYGIDDDLIVIPFDEALVSALWTFTLFSLPAIEWITSALNTLISFDVIPFAIAMLAFSIALFRYLISERRKQYSDRARWLRLLRVILIRRLEPKRNATVRSVQINFRIFYFLNNALLYVLLVCAGGPIIAFNADKLGAKIAVDEQAKFQEQGCAMAIYRNWSQCVDIVDSDGKLRESGLLAARTPLGLAIYDGKMTKIVSVKSSQILRIRQNEKVDR